MSEAIIVELARFPLVVVRMGDAAPTDEVFEGYLRRFETLMVDDVLYSMIMITMPSAPMTKPRHARIQAAWLREHEARISRHVASMAFVLPSPLMRGALRAILVMQPVPVQYEVFRDEDKALAWSEKCLMARRAAPPGSASR